MVLKFKLYFAARHRGAVGARQLPVHTPVMFDYDAHQWDSGEHMLNKQTIQLDSTQATLRHGQGATFGTGAVRWVSKAITIQSTAA